MRHMPRVVRLLTQRIIVSKKAKLYLEEDGHHSAAWGLFHTAGPSIEIAEGMGIDRQKVTFLHENLHLMLDVSQLDRLFEGGAEETLVGLLSPIMLSWMRENPAAMAYLMERA